MFNKPERKVDRVVVHCTASDNEDLYGPYLKEALHQWHVIERGWSAVGYNLIIDMKGRVLQGRPLERTPAAQRGHNTGSIAVCIHGLSEFTGESISTLQTLCNEINEAYGGDIVFLPHNHFDKNKECPVFSVQDVLQTDDEGYILQPLDFEC